MKRILLIASFMILISMSYGQTNVYHKFLGSNVEWTGRFDGYQSPSCYKFQYFLGGGSGDLIWGDSTYYFFYYVQTIYPHYYSGSMAGQCDFTGSGGGGPSGYGYLREDTIQRKVYYMDLDSMQEKLLYDFSLNVGDTMKSITPFSCNSIIVTQIDSILIYTDYRKRWKVSSGSCLWGGEIVEGIGSMFGLLEPMSNFERWGNVECYSQNSITMYSESPDCPVLVTGVDTQTKTKNVLIAPNPARNNITISQTEPSFNKYEIYGLNGKLISENKITELIQNVDLSGYTEGMYVVKLIGNQKVEFKKIVVVE